MSDAALRELEQAWQRSGSVEDEAHLLAARVRSGELAEEQLRLAAHAGHAAAVRALGVPRHERPLPEWLDGFAAFGHEALVRASIAIARLAWSRWPGFCKHPPETLILNPIDVMVEGAVATAEEYLCEATAENLRVHVEARQQVAHYAEHPLLSSYERALALATVRGAEQAAGAAEAFARLEIVGATAAELAPWALVGRDPVRERVEERRRLKLLAVAAHLGHEEARRSLDWGGPVETDLQDLIRGIVFVEADGTWHSAGEVPISIFPWPMVVDRHRHLVAEVAERLREVSRPSPELSQRLESSLEFAADREMHAGAALVGADCANDAEVVAEELGRDRVDRVLAEAAEAFYQRATGG